MKNTLKTMVFASLLCSIGANAQEDGAKRVNQYGLEVTATPLETEAQDGIINWTSQDGNYRLWMDNRVQVDAYMFPDKTYNELGNGITVRRARFALKGMLWHNWYGELDLDFSDSKAELKDAYIKYMPDSRKWNVKMGNFREGYGMETTTTSRYITFMERSFVNKFDPSRHLGIQGNYFGKNYLFIGGVHFNDIGGAEEVEISQDHNKDEGMDEGYSLTGRAVWAPINTKDALLHLGVAGTYRTPKTSWEDGYRISTRSHSSVNRKKYLDTDDIQDVDHVTGYTVELAGKYKGLMFQSEYKIQNVNREVGENASFDGGYVQAGYLLRGGRHNYNKREGEFTRITPGTDKGDIELALRYDYIDLNDFDAEIYGGSAEAYTIGINYYVNPNIRIQANYVYNNHDRFANGKGNLYVGHDADGNLTKDWANVVESDGDAGDDYGQFSLRLEMDF